MSRRGLKPRVNRRYLVTVLNAQGVYEYVERTGDDQEVVYINACAEFGTYNVGGVHYNDSAGLALERLRLKGVKAKAERCAC